VKIILVDDDPIVILLQKKLMEKVGMIDEVDSYNNGEEVLDFFINNSEEIAEYLVFLDINMPGLSGWQVLDKLIELKLDGNISVIIITSSIEQAEKEKSKQYDRIIDFWIKPFNLNSFTRLKENEITKKFFKEA
jgi:CheY-like chemotaxis protein